MLVPADRRNKKLFHSDFTLHLYFLSFFQRMELYQKKQLEVALLELKDISNEEKKALQERMMSIRSMKN